jgi:uncharacterized membrane protein (DUF2068 family)
MAARQSGLVVRLIGAFKLLKASILIGLCVGGALGRSDQLIRAIERAVLWAGLFPGHRQLHRTLEHLRHVDHATARKFGAAALAYAVVFVVEGMGLLLGKRWAEWLTVGVTASFVPVEVYELIEHFSAGKVAALVVNLAIVVYLVVRRLSDRRRFGRRRFRVAGASLG